MNFIEAVATIDQGGKPFIPDEFPEFGFLIKKETENGFDYFLKVGDSETLWLPDANTMNKQWEVNY